MKIHDSTTTAAAPRFIKDGYMTALVRVARVGIQDYLGSELGKPDQPRIRLYRPPNVVFDSKAVKSYAHRPITNDHPGEDVTASNWKKHAIGTTGQEVIRDGDFVSVPVMVMDAAAIEDVKNGKREWSMGLDANIEFTPGITDSGEHYDAVVTSMDMNHLALVHRARGGEELRIGDGESRTPIPSGSAHQPNGGHQMAGENLKVVIYDGLSIQTTEQGAQIIEKLQSKLKDAGANLEMITANHSREIATKDAEIKRLTDAALTPEAVAKLVDSRSALLAAAGTLAPEADFKGKTDEQVRSMAVAAKLGDAAVAGKDAAYIGARFDILIEDAKANGDDPMRAVLRDAKPGTVSVTDNGQAAYEARIANAWKGEATTA